jgi:pseudouridine synthase
MAEERLQKIIARSGLCSRREAERLIEEGRVTVDGHQVGLGDKADPARQHIKVDGKPIRPPEELRYLLLYKPREVMTTCDDPEERTTVVDLVRSHVKERVYPVGRLDYHSEGLIILTNDGDLAARVAHPRYGVVREYLVKIRGDLDEQGRRRLMAGTSIEGHRVKPLKATRERGTRGGNSWWRIQVSEGRTHEVRELFFRAGHHVQRLRRTAIGPVRDDTLRPGDFRTLTGAEVEGLKRSKRHRPTSRSREYRREVPSQGRKPGTRRNTSRTRRQK